MKGWVKLHRKIEDNPLWFREKFTRGQAWIDLLLGANHIAKTIIIRGIAIKIKRGQLGWSEVTMSKRWQWSRKKVRRFLKLLETEQQIKQQKYLYITTIVTILNYDKYQSGTASDTASDTAKEQQRDSKRHITKNVKNGKNIPSSASAAEKKPKHNFLGAEIIKALEGVDPKNKTYYSNKTQRAACDFLLDEYGLGSVLSVIEILPQTNQMPYMPTINSPNDLKEKWVKLKDGLQKKRVEITSKGRGVA